MSASQRPMRHAPSAKYRSTQKSIHYAAALGYSTCRVGSAHLDLVLMNGFSNAMRHAPCAMLFLCSVA